MKKFDELYQEYLKFAPVVPKVVTQKAIVNVPRISLVFHADEMPECEVFDDGSARKPYNVMSCEGTEDWVQKVYENRDNNEYVVAAVLQAACCDIRKILKNQCKKTLIEEIADDSVDKFGKIADENVGRYINWLHCEESKGTWEILSSDLSQKFKFDDPCKCDDYSKAAKCAHQLVSALFASSQFVEITEIVTDEEEVQKLKEYTALCRQFRRMKGVIAEKKASPASLEEFLKTVKPYKTQCEGKETTILRGTVVAKCERHGEYAIRIQAHAPIDVTCPACKTECVNNAFKLSDK